MNTLLGKKSFRFLGIITLMLFSIETQALSTDTPSVQENFWNTSDPPGIQAANRLAQEGIIENSSFYPEGYHLDSYITRREMLKIMMNLSSIPILNECKGNFRDLEASDWGCRYAETALSAGFISPNRYFRPDDFVTEAEALKMILQAKGFEKNQQIDDWVYAYTQVAYESGILPENMTVSETKRAKKMFAVLLADATLQADPGSQYTAPGNTNEDPNLEEDLEYVFNPDFWNWSPSSSSPESAQWDEITTYSPSQNSQERYSTDIGYLYSPEYYSDTYSYDDTYYDDSSYDYYDSQNTNSYEDARWYNNQIYYEDDASMQLDTNNSYQNNENSEHTSNPNTSGELFPKTYTVNITENSFFPDPMILQKGDSIHFVNLDTRLHWPTSTSSSGGGCENKNTPTQFDACMGLKRGEVFSFTFNESGRWNYYDRLHPEIRGVVIVR